MDINNKIKNFGPDHCLLYAISEDYSQLDKSNSGQTTLVEKVQAALDGGITMLQIRIKSSGFAKEKETVNLLREIRDKCRQYAVPFIINDYVDLAVELDADGVHLGVDDMPLAEARKLLGAEKVIGVTMKTVAGALEAQSEGADYLGVGAVFPTQTKANTSAMPLEKLRKICRSVDIPVVAIGGITAENMEVLVGTGIAGVALVSGVFSAPDVKRNTAKLASDTRRFFREGKKR